jgi:predicted dehydrogenase
VSVSGAAVVGCGVIGTRRALALEACGVPVVAVHDHEPMSARKLHDALGGRPTLAGSVDELLADERVQLVVVATSHDALAEIAGCAASQGRHVLVEKPGGLDGVTRLAAIAREHRVVVRVGYNHRFHPSLVRAKEIIGSGRYGPVLHVRARYGHGGRIGYESEWRARRAVSGGGELVDQGSHLIDLTRHLCGAEVALAFSELRTEYWDMDVEDNAFLALRTTNGAFAWLHASWSEWKNMFSFEITLRTAKVEIVGLGGSYGPERLIVSELTPALGPPEIITHEWPPGDPSWVAEVEDVLQEIGGHTAFGAGIDDATAVFRIIDGAYTR